MSRRRLALLLLACALVGSTGLRVAGAADKQGFTHDESISVLAAACHQGDYTRLTSAGEPPFGRWVPASDWKALMRPDRALCLGEIGRDLAREDIHPPLYFWLLHAWTLAFGVGLWTGVSLNIVLAALTGLALFGLARRILGDPLQAAAVAGSGRSARRRSASSPRPASTSSWPCWPCSSCGSACASATRRRARRAATRWGWPLSPRRGR